MTSIESQRQAVVAETLSWLGTPYHHAARVKGAGVDCGQLLAAVFEAAGVIPHVEPEDYPADWHCHRRSEKFLQHVEEHARKIDTEPLPGDIVLYKFGQCISHAGIVIEWPQIIHAYIDHGVPIGVVLDDAENNSVLTKRQAGFWSMWGGE